MVRVINILEFGNLHCAIEIGKPHNCEYNAQLN